jgi:hypothetical protein
VHIFIRKINTSTYQPAMCGLLCACEFEQGQLLKLDEDDMSEDMDGVQQQRQPASNGAAAAAAAAGDGSSSQLLTEQVKPRQGLPPLLVNLGER